MSDKTDTMPETNVVPEVKAEPVVEPIVKRGRGRPKGSKNKPKQPVVA